MTIMKQLEIEKSMVFASENNAGVMKLFDGNPRTHWIGGQCPGWLDVRFQNETRVRRIVLQAQKGCGCVFSVFASGDGVNFSEVLSQNDDMPRSGCYDLPCDVTCCALRFWIKYLSASDRVKLRGITLFGEATGAPAIPAAVELPEPFDATPYAAPVTAEETIAALYGLVERTVGKAVRDRFTFVLEDDGTEYFTISDTDDGRVCITANSGVNAACGLGWYYKQVCGLHFSQVGNRVNVPDPLPKIGAPQRLSTPFRVRYAYNYCALSYTMAFWGQDEWQQELDRLALQGVNVILDITALEEVWRRFLGKLGYTDDEARAFVTGPAYYAWFNMANIYGTGGPVPPAFFKQRTDLARRNHRFMKALGMMPVLQGYSGMVPTDIRAHVSDAAIIPQGLWNGLDRPAMLKTDTPAYRRLARLFYEAQKEVFGSPTIYYATDPFHEGGKSGRMKVERISAQIMQSLLESDPNAVWILQSWGENPSKALLDGIADQKEHTLILDLYAEKKPRWQSFLGKEFMGTPWVYCMLNNFGGRMGLHGHLSTIATEIARAASTAEHMKGVGITPEATFSNPIIFDLFFETIWSSDGTLHPIDLDEWIRGYCERRYGTCSDDLLRALDLLKQTVYNPDLNEHGEGAPESVINARPTVRPRSPSSWGNDVVAYDKATFEEAVRLFAAAHDDCKDCAGYRFDLIDLLKQVLSNTAQEYQRNMGDAYEANDVIGFMKWSDKFLRLIRFTDTILSGERTFLLGTWLGTAKRLAKDFDDFSQQLFEFNARALITTWAGSRSGADVGGLHDYSNKQWAGLTVDFYGKRWGLWVKQAIAELNGKHPAAPDWFRLENRWTWERAPYPDTPQDIDLKQAAAQVLSVYGVATAKNRADVQ